MSGLSCTELYFLLEHGGALLAYHQERSAWSSVIAFSTAERARRFQELSGAPRCEVVALALADRASVGALLRQLKPRAIRNLILDLDYATGRCLSVEFVGEEFGEAKEHQFILPPG